MSHIGNLLSHMKSDVTGGGVASTVDSPDGAPHDTIDEWGVFASTTEALTLTILTELVRRAGEHPEVPSSVAAIVGGVYAAEPDHWLFTSSTGSRARRGSGSRTASTVARAMRST